MRHTGDSLGNRVCPCMGCTRARADRREDPDAPEFTQDDVIYCAHATAESKTHAELTEAYVGAEILLHHARSERDRYKRLYEEALTRAENPVVSTVSNPT